LTMAFELFQCRQPIGSAAQMRATRIYDEQPIGSAVNPYAVFLLKLSIDAQTEVGRIADLENRAGLEQRARHEEAEECQKPGGEKCDDATPHQTPPLNVGGAVFGAGGGDAGR